MIERRSPTIATSSPKPGTIASEIEPGASTPDEPTEAIATSADNESASLEESEIKEPI